jgi:menaquinone-dependent protoporphyrinogen oxidase
MKPILVCFASRHGHTHTIAEHVAAALRARGQEALVWDVGLEEPVHLEDYEAVILAACVHRGRHERPMLSFVKAHREALDRLPTLFLSVSLSEATVEDPRASDGQRFEAWSAVQGMIERFVEETGWHPTRTRAVAGAMLYTRYGKLLQLLMKRIARAAGGSTDTTRDHVYTDWAALDHLVDTLVSDLDESSPERVRLLVPARAGAADRPTRH